MSLKPNTEHNNNEIPVISFRPLSEKHSKSSIGYCIPIELTDANGDTARSYVSASKVRDLPSAMDRMKKNIESRCVFRSGGMIVTKMMF